MIGFRWTYIGGSHPHVWGLEGRDGSQWVKLGSCKSMPGSGHWTATTIIGSEGAGRSPVTAFKDAGMTLEPPEPPMSALGAPSTPPQGWGA